MLRTVKHYALILLASWAVILMPTQAMAQTLLQCDPQTGTVINATELYNDGITNNPAAPGSVGSFCQFNVSVRSIFSTILCNYVFILNEVMGRVYCGIQFGMQNIVAILITVYIAIFGAQILMGHTQLTSKEIIVRLFKIVLVSVFITQSNYGVELMFRFFIDLADSGIWWTLNAIPVINTDPTCIPSSLNPCRINIAPTSGNLSATAMPVYVYIDSLIYNAVSGPFTQANSKVIGFFATMSFIMPPLFMMAIYWLWTTFTILARTLVSFMMSISAIAFLIALSPIFFSLMLFRATYEFFEHWLKFLISYSLQVVIVFACVAMWLIVMSYFVFFFNELSNVIFPYNKTPTPGSITTTDKSWGICPYKVTASLYGPRVVCTDPLFDPNPTTNPAGYRAAQARLIDLGNIKANICAPRHTTCSIPDESGANDEQTALHRLMYYVVYHLITLIIIAYAFDALLKQAPYIAKELAGPQYVAILGQGFGAQGLGKLKGVMRDEGRPKKPNMLTNAIGSNSRQYAGAIGGILGRRD